MAGGPWEGRPNPIAAVPKRKDVRSPPNVLRLEEVPQVLAELPEGLRPLYATALYTAMRKGELGGLRKEDVDLVDRTLRVSRSWDAPRTKDGKAGLLPITRALAPYLEVAMRSPGELVFPGVAGRMMRRDVALDRILRRALGRAGVVVGYDHRCRRHGCGFRERHSDVGADRCPRCSYQLYAKPIPRHVRFHDLRHTTVTLLLKDGVSLAVAQKVARHSDPKLTAEIYGHLELGDLAGRWSAWTSAPPPYPRRRLCPRSPPSRSLSAPSPVLRVDCGAASREKLRPQHRRKRQRCCGPMKSGRLDLNQRPLAPQASALPGCATPRHGPTGAAS